VIVAVFAISACAKLSFLPRHPEASGAVDRLLSDDQLLQGEAKVELLALGEGAMPEIRERFDEGSPEERRTMVEIVATIGRPNEVVRDVFIEAGRDSEPQVRQFVAFRSAHFTEIHHDLFPTLRTLAFDTVPEVQAAAITTLSGFSPPDTLSSEEILRLMRSGAPLVIAAATTMALTRPEPGLQEATRNTLPILVGEMMNPSPLVRAAVIIAIGRYGPAASPAAPPLAGTLAHDPVPEIRLQAALALMRTKMRSAREIALPSLQEFATSPNPALAGPAQRALAMEQPTSPQSGPPTNALPQAQPSLAPIP
jgi:HEAT repeat protein